MSPIQQMLLGLGGGGDGQWQSYIDTGFLGNAGDTTFGDYRLNNLYDVRIYNDHIYAYAHVGSIGDDNDEMGGLIKMKFDGTIVDTLWSYTSVDSQYTFKYIVPGGYTVDPDDNIYIMNHSSSIGPKRTYMAKFNSSFSQQWKYKFGPDLECEFYGNRGSMLYVPSYGGEPAQIAVGMAAGWIFIKASDGTVGNYRETTWDEGIRSTGSYAGNPVYTGDGKIWNTMSVKRVSIVNNHSSCVMLMDDGGRNWDEFSSGGLSDYGRGFSGYSNYSPTSYQCLQANDYKEVSSKKYFYTISSTKKVHNGKQTPLVYRYNITDDTWTMYGGVAHSTSGDGANMESNGYMFIKADDDGNLWGLLFYHGVASTERNAGGSGMWKNEVWLVKWNTSGTLVTNWRIRFDEDAFPNNWATENNHYLYPQGLDVFPDGDILVGLRVQVGNWHNSFTGSQDAYNHGAGSRFHILMKIKADGSNLGTNGNIEITNTAIYHSPGAHPSITGLSTNHGVSIGSGAFVSTMSSGNGFAHQTSTNTQNSWSNTSYDSTYGHWGAVKVDL